MSAYRDPPNDGSIDSCAQHTTDVWVYSDGKWRAKCRETEQWVIENMSINPQAPTDEPEFMGFGGDVNELLDLIRPGWRELVRAYYMKEEAGDSK